MMNELEILNLSPGNDILPSSTENVFVIKTCQRIIFIGIQGSLRPFLTKVNQYEHHTGHDAYHFLLETICGLKSKILGEYEIVSQFKKAYQEYVQLPKRNGSLIKIIEKLFKDSKEVRTNHLLGIGQLSYSGISKKILIQHARTTNSPEQPVVIVGTGNLAEDILKLLTKKSHVILIGRNKEKQKELAEKYGVDTLPWEEKNYLHNQAFIVNTVGATETLFDEDFFISWKTNQFEQSIFIDLGSPSSIKTSLTSTDNVLRLEDIFKECAKLSTEKLEKIQAAKRQIAFLVEKKRHFSMLETLDNLYLQTSARVNG